LWEFEGGQLAVDVDRTALNPMKDSSGKTIEVLPKLQDRLFRRSLDLGSDETYNVFSPQLRDSNIINGLNTILMKIEDACSLSRGTLSTVNYTDARTATELKILKQRCYAANTDIQLELERTLESVIYIMEKYCDLYNIVPAGKFEVSYSWDDSIIVDKDSERQVDLLDVDKGLMSKVEYRMKWKGETRDQAEEALKLIADEKRESMELVQSVVNTKTEEPAQRTTEAEASNDKLKRANESLETTKK
jgi:A118 family predicted phage portal protein